ncbi:hypothetical protein BV25DRAFT_1914567 [Artomyces pyxidatus]|uniref:Uncharacterized protein n=1 Tax=Artomyces pyxidatus TaxID=48021 RepID=A0ACB8T7H1_9AGAM|nr:hypothetical protein BV25DRAFT_1914567 [Artomyces pyxidatus]
MSAAATGSNPSEMRGVPHQPRRTAPPGPPARVGRVIAGGMAVISATWVGMYYYMHWNHSKKAQRDPSHPRSVSSWEHRMQEQARPASGTGAVVRRASDVAARLTPLDAPVKEHDRAGHRTIATVNRDGEGDAMLLAGNGSRHQPAPQRDRGDGMAYTKLSVVVKPANGAVKEA